MSFLSCSRILFPLLVGGLAVCGCSDSGGGGGHGSTAAGASTGTIDVQITDAPLRDLSKVTKAEITVERVVIHAAQITSATTASVASGATASANANANPNASTGAANPNANANANGQSQSALDNAKGQNPNALANSNPGSAGGNSGGAMGQGSQGAGGNGGAGQGGGNGNGAGNAKTGGQEIVIFDAATEGGSKAYNLLDLRGGIMAALVKANLPAGRYTHLRLELSGAEVVVDGNSYSLANGLLTIPSGGTAGLKIPFQGAHSLDVQAGQTAQALLDFDLSRSFNVIGPPTNPTQITMSPVIRGANLAASGNLAGVVTTDSGTPADTSDDMPLANAVVTVTETNVPAGQQPATITTFTDAAGVYYVPGLSDGSWDVLFEEGGHDSLTQSGVAVSAGQQTTVDVTITKK
jgi:hypothetical protein